MDVNYFFCSTSDEISILKSNNLPFLTRFFTTSCKFLCWFCKVIVNNTATPHGTWWLVGIGGQARAIAIANDLERTFADMPMVGPSLMALLGISVGGNFLWCCCFLFGCRVLGGRGCYVCIYIYISIIRSYGCIYMSMYIIYIYKYTQTILGYWVIGTWSITFGYLWIHNPRPKPL